MTYEFLNPGNKLVDEVADWLCGRAKTDTAGAKSLAHVMIVVPTAQSGRNLRLALAQRFENGIVPPMVVLPMQLVKGPDRASDVASNVQDGAAFLKFMKSCGDGGPEAKWPTLFKNDALSDHDAILSFLDQLEELWDLLSAGGFLMRDVPENDVAVEVLEKALGNEKQRWMELADFEKSFFGFLHCHGLRHRAEILRDTKSNPPDLPKEIEEIVLPALADPVPIMFDALDNQRKPRKVIVLAHAHESERDKFDEWGRPRIDCWTGDRRPDLSEKLRDNDIVCAATDGKLAKKIADEFPEEDGDFAVPSLGLCDDELFDSLSASLLGRGWILHNPEKYRLSSSSLGRIAGRLVSLYAVKSATFPWDEFTGLLREDDVLGCVKRHLRRWAQKAIDQEKSEGNSQEGAGEANKESPEEIGSEGDDENGKFVSRAAILEGIDICRNTFVPSALPKDCEFDKEAIAKSKQNCVEAFSTGAKCLCDIIAKSRDGANSAATFLRKAIVAIFSGRNAGDAAQEKEFAAAAETLRETTEQFDDEAISGLDLDDAMATALLRKRLAEATYSLEPDSHDALKSEGWLELAWSSHDKIALAGFREGAVPDSVSGHVFLPDSMRAALGLPSNDRRLARDSFLLQSILDSRNPGDVRAYFARTGDEGDIHRPSRLLFLVGDNALAARAKALFGELPPDEAHPPRAVADGWGPRLPNEVPLPSRDKTTPEGRLSPSAINEWLKCPFTYFLKYGLGMERVEEKDELGADNFGTVVHDTLEAYAKEQMDLTGRNLPQLSDKCDIERAIKRIFGKIRSRYGTADLKVRIQLDAAERRLKNFAAIQAECAKAWQIVGAEVKFVVRPFENEGDADVFIKGSADRIDFNAAKGVYRVIDYKTWDEKKEIQKHLLKKSEAHIEHARLFGLPTFQATNNKGARNINTQNRFISIQLPLYGRCLEKLDPLKYTGKIAEYGYLLLGKDKDETSFRAIEGIAGIETSEVAKTALETARIAIRAIRASIFWPPGPDDGLRYGSLKEIFLNSPENDLKDSTWMKSQKERRDRFLSELKEERSAMEGCP